MRAQYTDSFNQTVPVFPDNIFTHAAFMFEFPNAKLSAGRRAREWGGNVSEKFPANKKVNVIGSFAHILEQFLTDCSLMHLFDRRVGFVRYYL